MIFFQVTRRDIYFSTKEGAALAEQASPDGEDATGTEVKEDSWTIQLHSWKITMESKNHIVKKEDHLPNLHF